MVKLQSLLMGSIWAKVTYGSSLLTQYHLSFGNVYNTPPNHLSMVSSTMSKYMITPAPLLK